MISEAAVIAVAAALYLLDCVVLLERGQAVLEARGSPLVPRMRLDFGSTHYQIAGKTVALLNPLTPFLPAFRSLALFSPPGSNSIRVSKAVAATSLLAPFAFAQFLLVFVALPVCLYRALVTFIYWVSTDSIAVPAWIRRATPSSWKGRQRRWSSLTRHIM